MTIQKSTELLPGSAVPADRTQVRTIPVDCLYPGDTPRVAGENLEHTRLLGEAPEALPPLLVHRQRMRVIDGMHRLRAAQVAGRRAVEVQFFDGTDADAFVEAVRANVAHGLPLSLADREAAATRIIDSHGHWSDRVIAEVVGLAPKTVGAIRRRTGAERGKTARVGRDGRVRPVDNREARDVALSLIRQRPGASLREVARAAGLSPTTVLDIRRRMESPEEGHPNPPAQRAVMALAGKDAGQSGSGHPPGRARLLRNLSKDPSLRFTESGRTILRWLSARIVGPQEWPLVSGGVPPHCLYTIAELSRSCAQELLEFAGELEQQARDSA